MVPTWGWWRRLRLLLLHVPTLAISHMLLAPFHRGAAELGLKSALRLGKITIVVSTCRQSLPLNMQTAPHSQLVEPPFAIWEEVVLVGKMEVIPLQCCVCAHIEDRFPNCASEKARQLLLESI